MERNRVDGTAPGESSPPEGTSLGRFVAAWEAVLANFLRKGDTPEQRRRKHMMVAGSAALIALGVFRVINLIRRGVWLGYAEYTQYYSFVLTAVQLWRSYVTNGLSDLWVGAILSCWGAVLCFHDLRAATGGVEPRAWPFIVVILDTVLMFRLPMGWAAAFIAATFLHLLLIGVEMNTRFGLLDLAFLPPYDDRSRHCECEKPPCATGAPWIELPTVYVSWALVMLDFLLTRSFAMQARRDQAYLEQTVDAAIEVATHLGTFHLDGAVQELQKHRHHMPPKLSKAYAEILQRLRGYHAYVPPPAFHEIEDDRTFATRHSMHTLESHDFLQMELFGSPASSSQRSSDNDLLSVSARREDARMALPTPFRSEEVSLLAVAMPQSPLRAEADLASFLTAHRELLGQVVSASSSRHGVLDRVVGDHFYATFNASLACPAHSNAAVSAASDIAASPLGLTMAVTTGRGWCGSLGTATFKCFSVLGTLPLFLDGMLRAAPDLDCAGCVLVGPLTRLSSDVRHSFPFRRVMRRVRAAAHAAVLPGEDIALWTLVPGAVAEAWETYNRAVELLMAGNKAGASRTIAEASEYVAAYYRRHVAGFGPVTMTY